MSTTIDDDEVDHQPRNRASAPRTAGGAHSDHATSGETIADRGFAWARRDSPWLVALVDKTGRGTVAWYVFSRLGQAVGVLFGAYLVTFIGIHLLPGDPISNFLNAGETPLPQESIDTFKEYYGANESLWQQLIAGFRTLFDGTFGYSFISGRTVLTEFGNAIGPTLALASVAAVFLFIFVLLIVSASALSRHNWIREAATSLPPFVASLPTFLVGIVALEILSIRLQVMSLFPDGSFLSLAVPGAILGLYLSAPVSQVLVRAVTRAQSEPLVMVLRAKGASESYIYFRHLLKYTAGSAVTIVGLLVGNLLAGTVFIETVFSRQGIGQVLYDAVSNQDIALVQGFVLIFATGYVVVNLIVDLLYPLLDPRVTVGADR